MLLSFYDLFRIASLNFNSCLSSTSSFSPVLLSYSLSLSCSFRNSFLLFLLLLLLFLCWYLHLSPSSALFIYLLFYFLVIQTELMSTFIIIMIFFFFYQESLRPARVMVLLSAFSFSSQIKIKVQRFLAFN